MGVRYQKYRSIAIPLNIGIELSQVSRYFDISNIEPALVIITGSRSEKANEWVNREQHLHVSRLTMYDKNIEQTFESYN